MWVREPFIRGVSGVDYADKMRSERSFMVGAACFTILLFGIRSSLSIRVSTFMDVVYERFSLRPLGITLNFRTPQLYLNKHGHKPIKTKTPIAIMQATSQKRSQPRRPTRLLSLLVYRKEFDALRAQYHDAKDMSWLGKPPRLQMIAQTKHSSLFECNVI